MAVMAAGKFLLFNIGSIWVFPKIGVPQNGLFILENPVKIDDLGGKINPLFLETSIHRIHQGRFFRDVNLSKGINFDMTHF